MRGFGLDLGRYFELGTAKLLDLELVVVRPLRTVRRVLKRETDVGVAEVYVVGQLCLDVETAERV
jgi:hypothetical protein